MQYQPELISTPCKGDNKLRMAELLVGVLFMLWVTALEKVLRNRRAAFRLSKKNYLRNQRYRIFRFRQTQRFLALVGIAVCGLTRVCRIFHYRSVWVRERSSDWWHRVVNRTWTADDWRKNFRMCKETLNHICDELAPEISRQNTRFRRAIPTRQRVAVALWRLATNVEYRTISHLFGIGRSTACGIVHDVCRAIVQTLLPIYIQLPQGERLDETIRGFERIKRFPQVGGVIDGCHIPIIAPEEHHEDYHNRKGYHSIILQGVVDPKYCFTDVFIGWPGRVHDARVLANSPLYGLGQNGTLFPPDKTEVINGVTIPVVIIGDAAYPLLEWLMKPYADNGRLTPSQRAFNNNLSSTRMAVEIAFGRLKGHWRILLKRLDMKTQNVPLAVGACCTLHNICEIHGEAFDDNWWPNDNDDDDNLDDDGDGGVAVAALHPAVAMRNAISLNF